MYISTKHMKQEKNPRNVLLTTWSVDGSAQHKVGEEQVVVVHVQLVVTVLCKDPKIRYSHILGV